MIIDNQSHDTHRYHDVVYCKKKVIKGKTERQRIVTFHFSLKKSPEKLEKDNKKTRGLKGNIGNKIDINEYLNTRSLLTSEE